MTKYQSINSHMALLDRPVWGSLSTCLAATAERCGSARAFPREIGPLAAAGGFAPDQIRDFLLLLSQRKAPLITCEVETPFCRKLCIAESQVTGVQMLAQLPSPPRNTHRIVDLNASHAGQILELARSTKPGPFDTKTHTLGDFIGIFQDERLVAMAGQRLQIPGFTEISAVCVDPNHRGQGMGAELVRQMSQRILDAGNVPFLHAYAKNVAAISLYESLGFTIRTRMQVTNWFRNALVQYD